VTCSGRPEITQVGFDHTEANSLMTLFTTRMLNSGFLASSALNPTWAHQPRHVDAYIQAAESVFQEITEALEKNDIEQRINHKPKHTGFARLVE
jgi:glutamate-1-semialdehyde 2,1-aminomutase